MMIGWFFSLFFLGLLSSQTLSDLSATLIFISTIYYWHKGGKKLKFPKLGIEIIFAAWVIIVFTGLMLNKQPETNWFKNFIEFRWILELYVWILALALLKPTFENLKMLCYPLAIASVYAIGFYFFKMERTGGFMNNPMPFAHSYGTIGMFMMGPILFMSKEELLKNKLWIITAILTLLAVVLSFTRGVWIGMTIGLIVMAFLMNWKRGLQVIFSLGVILLILFTTVTPIKERILFTLNPSKTYDTERILLWKANWEIFKDYPFFGIGYSENSRRVQEYYDKMKVTGRSLVSHAHNQYIHFLAGTGALGLSCFLIIIGTMFKIHLQAFWYFKNKKMYLWAGLAAGVIGAQVSFYVGGLTEANFSISINRYVLVLMWAFGCWLWFKAKSLNAHGSHASN